MAATAAEMRKLRVKARMLGASGTNIRSLDEDELRETISKLKKSKNGNPNSKGSKMAVKVSKKSRRVIEEDDEDEDFEDEDDDDDEDEPVKKKRGPGRPKGSKTKTKVTKTKAKKKSRVVEDDDDDEDEPVKKSKKRKSGPQNGTRIAIPDRLRWNKKYSYREGSQSQYILDQLRKAADRYDSTSEIRQYVFRKLQPKINERDELTFINRETGKPHKRKTAEARLKLVINRVLFDYASDTGQHDTGATKKRAPKKDDSKVKKSKRASRVDDDDDDDLDEEDEDEDEVKPKKRGPGRPKGSTNKKKKKSKSRA